MQQITSYCRSATLRHTLLCGLSITLLGSLFIYLAHFGINLPLLNTLTGLLSLYLLLISSTRTWFFSGFFFGLLWFWWIGLSFIHYHMSWAIPFVVLFIALVYGGLFWLIAKTAALVDSRWSIVNRSVATQRKPKLLPTPYSLLPLITKALGLLILSYIHPFTFDWFKPELMFVESFIGIQKWQFSLVLLALVLTIWRKQPLFLLLILLSYSPVRPEIHTQSNDHIQLVTTHTPVEEKWDKNRYKKQFTTLLHTIDQAIDANKTLIILPESVFPVFLKRNVSLFNALKKRAQHINIVTGALYWDGITPRNSTYIFTTDGKVLIANKVILVPFGEANPLPDFLSDWINKVFYDDAVDYQASSNVVDYTVDGKTYRNAICFEATSERLYEGKPKCMIVLSNNGWFTPSIEPTLQRLLLQYYSRKYGTTIYHAVNMAPSYMIQPIK